MAFRDFLYYSNSDRRSIVIIALIAVVLVGVLVVSVPKSGGVAVVEAEADSTEQTQPVALHEFDPNTVDSLSLIGFGLAPKQVQTFLRYRRAGAVFRAPESIAKVYGLSAEDVSRLQPYVRIAPEYAERSKPVYYERETVRQKSVANGSARGNGAEQKRNYPEKFDRLTKVDPNTADTALLQRIPGVGTWISRNIVEQRKRLGGFHAVEQLLEVKYFSPELLEWFEVDTLTAKIEKISINTASFQRLNSHPYIAYEQARDLLRYIRLYGRISDIDALRRTGIFTENELARLQPYLQF
jgi:DNA uptake protein ComE-like DNA-binding protein